MNDVDYDQLTILKIVCCCLSLIGSTFVISTFLLISQLRLPSFKLMIMLQISSLIYCIAELINNEDGSQGDASIQCLVQATLINYGLTSQFLCTVLIAQNMHRIIVKNNDSQSFLIPFILGVALPLCLSIYPLFFHAYGPVIISCWIRSNLVLQMINFYAVLLIAFILNTMYYISTWRFLRAIFENDIFLGGYKLAVYPLILFFCWIWSAINQLILAQGEFSKWITMFAITFQALQGFFYFIAYCLTPQVQTYVFNKFINSKLRRSQSHEMTNRTKRSQSVVQNRSAIIPEEPNKRISVKRSNSVTQMPKQEEPQELDSGSDISMNEINLEAYQSTITDE